MLTLYVMHLFNNPIVYNIHSLVLLFDHQIDCFQDRMDPVEACRGSRGVITKYQTRFQSGSIMDTNNVDIARCTGGRCSHTFQPPSNLPSSYDIVSVVAINVLGVGPARTCTTQSISKLKCYYVSLDEHKTFLCQELVSAHIHFLPTFYTKVCILQRERHCVNFKSIVNTV